MADKQSLWFCKNAPLFFPTPVLTYYPRKGCFRQTIQFGGPGNLVRRGDVMTPFDGPCVAQWKVSGSVESFPTLNIFDNLRVQAF